jgi:superfamily II DNA helicase RecQ
VWVAAHKNATGKVFGCLGSFRATMSAESVAEAVFSVTELRSEQRDAISAITSGQNVVVVLPTGFGKSLCYQEGALLMKGFTIVITPLLALCDDQVRYMRDTLAVCSQNLRETGDFHCCKCVCRPQQ